MSTVLKSLERRARRLIPATLRVPPRVFANLEFRYGHLKTVRLGRPVERNGDPLPWYTYPAIEYLQQLDFSDADVFEYGSGNSTLFWNRAAQTVTAVEDDEAWYRPVASDVRRGAMDAQELGRKGEGAAIIEVDRQHLLRLLEADLRRPVGGVGLGSRLRARLGIGHGVSASSEAGGGGWPVSSSS